MSAPPPAQADAARLARERAFHRDIAADAEVVWNWAGPAGQHRVRRRVELFLGGGALGTETHALELGCGTGLFLEQVAAACAADITALDLSEHLLDRARARLGDRARLVCGNAEQMPFPDAAFDVVYGSSVLHHLDVPRALAEVRRVLRPGGRLVFAEPNLVNPQVTVMFKLGATKRYFGVSPDEMAFTRCYARRVLERLGFADVEVRPFDFVHPAVPAPLIRAVARLGRALERLPAVRELAGSLALTAIRP